MAGRIVVIGATGFTGRLVARELATGAATRATGATGATGAGAGAEASPAGGGGAGAPEGIVLTGRDRSRVEALAREVGGDPGVEVVDVEAPASLEGAIRPGDAVINCAGPFAELGEPVVAACVAAGASYVDTTGEQPWMRTMWQRYDERARAAGVAVVNGMAFEWALGDCGAALLSPFETLDVAYAWGGTASSRGTRRTSVRIMGTHGWELTEGRWRRRAPGASVRSITFADGRARRAITFGAGEVVTVPRWSEATTVRGWLVMSRRKARIARVLSPVLPALARVLRPILEPVATRAGDPTEAERTASRFTIRLEAETAAGEAKALEIRGVDPYGLTAAIAVAGARRALEPDAPAGVLAPSQLVDPATLLGSLAGRGLEVRPEP